MTDPSRNATSTVPAPAVMPTHWAPHRLIAPCATADPAAALLSPKEAARVQHHRDRLMAALQAQDRRALLCAKQQVLDDAFCPTGATARARAGVLASPAFRSALRDLSWRMAGLLLTRNRRH